MTVAVSMTVNGKAVSGEVESRTLLVQFIRENLGLTGTHVGCDTSQCGACVVHVDGVSAKACTMLAVQAEGAEVTTIEGVANNGELHPMQAAFRENHGLQCGFCTPGMVMSALDLVNNNPDPSETEIREWLDELVKAESGRWEFPHPNSRGGAPVELFRLWDDPMTDDITPHGDTESEGSVVVIGDKAAENAPDGWDSETWQAACETVNDGIPTEGIAL